jgi:hypothetical protein
LEVLLIARLRAAVPEIADPLAFAVFGHCGDLSRRLSICREILGWAMVVGCMSGTWREARAERASRVQAAAQIAPSSPKDIATLD